MMEGTAQAIIILAVQVGQGDYSPMSANVVKALLKRYQNLTWSRFRFSLGINVVTTRFVALVIIKLELEL